MNKKLVWAWILALTLLLSNTVTSFADPVGSSETPTLSREKTVETVKFSLSNKLNTIKDKMQNSGYGQYGLLYNLDYLVQYAGYLDLILSVEDEDLVFSEEEKAVYKKTYKSLAESFNARFSNDPSEGEEILPLKVTVPTSEEDSQVRSSIKTLVENEVPAYCISYLDFVKGKYAVTISGTEVTEGKEALSEVSKEVTQINSIMTFMSGHLENSRSLLPHKELEEGEKDPRLDGLANYNLFKAQMEQNSEALAVLYSAKDVSATITNPLGNVEFKEASTYIEQFANVSLKQNLKDEYGVDIWNNDSDLDHYQINEVYLACLAASSVYTPMVSKVGEDRFLNALKEVAGEDSADEVVRLYDQAKEFRKPLFMVKSHFFSKETTYQGGGKTKYSGDATKITLGDLLEQVEKQKKVGLVTVKGSLQVNPQDGNSYAYFMEPGAPSSSEDDEKTLAKRLAASTVIPDGTTVSTTHWTDIVFEMGKDSLSGTLNAALLNNIAHDLRNTKVIDDIKNSYLYVDVFGDITLDDGTVVVPGAANASLCGKVYNPFTVAFYNNYPTIKPDEELLSFYDPNAVGKFVLTADTDKPPKSGLSNFKDDILTDYVTMYKVAVAHSLASFSGVKGTYLVKKFYNANQGELDTTYFVVAKKPIRKSNFVAFNSVVSQNIPVLPYDPSLDEGGAAAALIAKNMFWSYVVTKSGTSNVSNGALREDWIFRNLIVEVMNGTPYSASYQKHTEIDQIEEPYGFFTKLIVSMTNELLDHADKDQILGLKNRYESAFFGKVYKFMETYSFYICVLLGFVFLANFLRQRFNLVYSVGVTAMAVALVYTFVNVLPVYVPIVYNTVVNNTGKNTSYDLVLAGAEVYGESYKNATQFGKDGRFESSLGSVTIYKLSKKDREAISNNLNLQPDDFTNGDAKILDSTNGIYLEGDTIKVNLDRLFLNTPVIGSYSSGSNGSIYQLKAYKEYSSMLDYYMPYNQMVDGFVKTLNTMLTHYNIPRHTVQYMDGLNKDSFLVYSYVNSLMFLSPDNLGIDNVAQPDDLEILEDRFGDPYDFLHIRELVENPSEAQRETLWWRTLSQNGYLDRTPESEERLENLIYYVNYHTREFVLSLDPQLGLISDENLIKVIGLHATMLFNQKVSSWGNWLYPVFLNYPEFQMKDVYRVSLSDDVRKFAEANLDVVDYVYTQKGTLAVLGLAVVLALSWVITLVVPGVIHALYLLLLALLLWRFVAGLEMKPLIAGYAKASLAFFILYSIFTTVTANVTSLLILLLVYIVCVLFLLGTVLAILDNFTELGNGSYAITMKKMLNKLSRGKFFSDRNQIYGPRVEEDVQIVNLVDPDYQSLLELRPLVTPLARRRKRKSTVDVEASSSNFFSDFE